MSLSGALSFLHRVQLIGKSAIWRTTNGGVSACSWFNSAIEIAMVTPERQMWPSVMIRDYCLVSLKQAFRAFAPMFLLIWLLHNVAGLYDAVTIRFLATTCDDDLGAPPVLQSVAIYHRAPRNIVDVMLLMHPAHQSRKRLNVRLQKREIDFAHRARITDEVSRYSLGT